MLRAHFSFVLVEQLSMESQTHESKERIPDFSLLIVFFKCMRAHPATLSGLGSADSQLQRYRDEQATSREG